LVCCCDTSQQPKEHHGCAIIIDFTARGAVTDPLTDLLRKGARDPLQVADEAGRDAFLAEFADRRPSDGRAAVVVSGHHPERAVQTGIGPVTVKVQKVRAKDGKPVTFRSALVAPYVRKAKSIEAALPRLYLKGISTGEMGAALKMLLGPDATGFSARVISRLKGQWAAEHNDWRKADLSRDDWGHVWADDIHSGLRGSDDLPKRPQPKARKMLHDIWQAGTREDAHAALDPFIKTFSAKYPKAAA
jgi:transposase-like protein